MSQYPAGLQTSAHLDLEQLYRREYPALVRLAATLVQDQDDAQDVVHEAFVGLQRRWPRLEDPGRAAGYLRVSVINGARSLHRRRALVRRRPLVDSSVAPAADAPALLREEYLAVVAAVRRLPRRQLQAVALRYWSQMSDGDIAAALGVSEVTVRSHISRGLRTVAAHLEELT